MKNKEVLDYIKKSFELKNQGHYKQAIEMLYKALAMECDNIEILAQLAHLYDILGNEDRAICYIEKVLDIDPNHIDCLHLLKNIFIKKSDLPCALETAEKIYQLKLDSSNLAQIINILSELNNFAKINELEKLQDAFDDSVLYEFALAHYKNNNAEKAVTILEKGLDQNKNNTKIMQFLGKLYYDKNEFKKADKIFKKLEALDNTGETLNYLGLLNLNEKDFQNAITYFTKAQKLGSQNAGYAYNLASAYFLNGWLDEAAKLFNQAICLDSENTTYRYSLAYLYYQKELYEKALSELNDIKKVDPEHELSNILNAMIIAKKGDLLEAKTILEQIENPDDFTYYALFQVYKDLYLKAQAKESLKKAIELNPSSLDYLNNLLNIEMEENNLDTSKKIAEKIIGISPSFINSHIALAKIAFLESNHEELYDVAQELIELDPSCAYGYYYNAITLFIQKDKDFAIESLKKAISLDLNNADFYLKMSEFYQELGDFENAFAWAKEACEINDSLNEKWLCAKLATTLKKDNEAAKYFSQSYRQDPFNNDLASDYAKFLSSIGKEKQAKKIRSTIK